MNPAYENEELQKAVITICHEVKREGGVACIVGGCVRDTALGLPVKDIDMEVFNIPPKKLLVILKRSFDIDLVGQAFGIIKVRHFPIDIAIPRLESKTGHGHRAFEVHADPSLSREEAAARRDFTINAIALDPLTDILFDPFHGLDDLQNRILRHTTSRFSEDPLRVLRGMQFAARFEMQVAPETIQLCRTIQPEGLPPERIFDEWKKLILLGKQPSRGLLFLRDCGWIQYFPELQALINCPQDPLWHPEGDVWNHTLLALDAFAAQRINEEMEDLTVGLAVLCHDFGKPLCTHTEDGRIRSIAHDRAAEEPTRTFLKRMTSQNSLIEEVLTLVLHHMRPHELFQVRASDSAIRRLATEVKRIDRLVRVDRADRAGRAPDDAPPDQRCGDWLLEKAHQLDVADAAPKPIIRGRHLQRLGLSPGASFGPLLKACYEAQLEGLFTDESAGLVFLKHLLAERQTSSTGRES